MCTKNYDHTIHGSWDKVCDGQMEGWTDGEKDGQTDKKWHIEVGAPPKNYDDLKKNAKTFEVKIQEKRVKCLYWNLFPNNKYLIPW